VSLSLANTIKREVNESRLRLKLFKRSLSSDPAVTNSLRAKEPTADSLVVDYRLRLFHVLRAKSPVCFVLSRAAIAHEWALKAFKRPWSLSIPIRIDGFDYEELP
jgi:hypothetical protein